MSRENKSTEQPQTPASLVKPVLAFFVSLVVVALCIMSLSTIDAGAAMNDTPVTSPPVTTSVTSQSTQQVTGTEPIVTTVPYDIPATDPKDTNDGGLLENLGLNDNNGALELVIIITILTLAPSILIMMTCFTRIIVVFSLLRNAMGIQTTPPNQVLVGLALFLSLFIMTPVLSEMNEVAYQPYRNGEMTTIEAVSAASVPLKKWMLRNTSQESMDFFLELSEQEMPTGTDDEIADALGLEIVAPSFMISELKLAFSIGFLLFLPFLIIDIVVSSTLMSMGMIMLPPSMISMPFKILLFVLVNGWANLASSLVRGFYR